MRLSEKSRQNQMSGHATQPELAVISVRELIGVGGLDYFADWLVKV